MLDLIEKLDLSKIADGGLAALVLLGATMAIKWILALLDRTTNWGDKRVSDLRTDYETRIAGLMEDFARKIADLTEQVASAEAKVAAAESKLAESVALISSYELELAGMRVALRECRAESFEQGLRMDRQDAQIKALKARMDGTA